jgi:hypothetical protein
MLVKHRYEIRTLCPRLYVRKKKLLNKLLGFLDSFVDGGVELVVVGKR